MKTSQDPFEHDGSTWVTVTRLTLAAEVDREQRGLTELARVARALGLPQDNVKQLKAAVTGALRRAREAERASGPAQPIVVRLLTLTVTTPAARRPGNGRHGRTAGAPQGQVDAPLAPFGWGFFLVEKLADRAGDLVDRSHLIDVFTYRGGL